MTIFARDLDTGMAKWLYQMTPHDEWDYDGVNEMILTDLEIDGQERQVLVHFDRNGFAYTLDRVTGELLVAEKRSEEHTSELQSLMRFSYAVICLTKKNHQSLHIYYM